MVEQAGCSAANRPRALVLGLRHRLVRWRVLLGVVWPRAGKDFPAAGASAAWL